MKLSYEQIDVMDLEEVADELMRETAFRLIQKIQNANNEEMPRMVEASINLYKVIMGIETWS